MELSDSLFDRGVVVNGPVAIGVPGTNTYLDNGVWMHNDAMSSSRGGPGISDNTGGGTDPSLSASSGSSSSSGSGSKSSGSSFSRSRSIVISDTGGSGSSVEGWRPEPTEQLPGAGRGLLGNELCVLR